MIELPTTFGEIFHNIRRRPLLAPSSSWKCILALSHLWIWCIYWWKALRIWANQLLAHLDNGPNFRYMYIYCIVYSPCLNAYIFLSVFLVNNIFVFWISYSPVGDSSQQTLAKCNTSKVVTSSQLGDLITQLPKWTKRIFTFIRQFFPICLRRHGAGRKIAKLGQKVPSADNLCVIYCDCCVPAARYGDSNHISKWAIILENYIF